MTIGEIPFQIINSFKRGTVIPAMPLALDAQRQFDRVRQRALIRYYIDSRVGGIAVGVHSTQFEIRETSVGLFEPVLQFASDAIDSWCENSEKEILKIAGVAGRSDQARSEAEFALKSGYHACLLSLGAFGDDPESTLISHALAIAEIIPVIGFYLQPSVGGRELSFEFFREFAQIENVFGIKIAPFDRYKTIDAVRGVVEARRENDVTLYTGNDDTIVQDLLTPYRLRRDGSDVTVRMKGGLLGHWGFWTKRAVELLEQIHAVVEYELDVPLSILSAGAEITDVNSAVFDPKHEFNGCIPGIHEMLVRQGLFGGRWCLDSSSDLSPGQLEEIERVHRSYPHLNDYDFVRSHISEWMGG